MNNLLLKYIIFGLAIFIIAPLSSCTTEDNGGNSGGNAEEITISGISDTEWSYISFTSGTVVGTSKFGSAEEDEAWKARTDWDVAYCGEYMRTNGGTSGSGSGAIQRIDDKTFDEASPADATNMQTDSYAK